MGGDQADDSAEDAGAVYVFVRDGQNVWSQQSYIKASSPDWVNEFGWSLALSQDGTLLAVGAPGEAGGTTGIGDDLGGISAEYAGAAYVFVRDGQSAWSQQAYVKASNTEFLDYFGYSVALSGDGTHLAVGAPGEDSSATGIGGDQLDDSAPDSGAVYLY